MPPEELHQTLLGRDDELKKIGMQLHELEGQKAVLEAEKKQLLEENAQLSRFYKQPLRGMARRLKGKVHRSLKQKRK